MDGTQNLSFILSQNLGEKDGTTGVKLKNENESIKKLFRRRIPVQKIIETM